MPISTTKLIQHWQRVKQAEAKQSVQPPSHYLCALVVESLSHTERAVYQYLADKGTVSSHVVAKRFALSLNHALNILAHLHQYGLVTKERNTENAYREYLWSVANDNE